MSPIDDCERVSDCRPSANELQGEEGGGGDVGAILLERFQTHGLSKLVNTPVSRLVKCPENQQCSTDVPTSIIIMF